MTDTDNLTTVPCGCGDFSIEVSNTSVVNKFDVVCPECDNHFGWREKSGKYNFLEELSALEHRQWIHWTKALAKREDLPDGLVERWEENWIPYGELEDDVKEQDREWARKALKIMKGNHE